MDRYSDTADRHRDRGSHKVCVEPAPLSCHPSGRRSVSELADGQRLRH